MYQSFRTLTDDEIEQVAGVYDGCGGNMWPPEYYTTTIYVTYTPPSNPWVQSMSLAYYMDNYYQDPYAHMSYAPPSGGGGGGGGGGDSATHDVNEYAAPQTQEQQNAVNELKEAVARMTGLINSIPDSATLTLPTQQTVTGAELKSLWANADFNVHPAGTPYDNRGGGEANYNNGNPIISFNIDLLTDYVQGRPDNAGANYLILHELAHLTGVQRISYDYTNPTVVAAYETQANDIARAFANYWNQPIISDPNNGIGGYGYSAGNPMTVTVN